MYNNYNIQEGPFEAILWVQVFFFKIFFGKPFEVSNEQGINRYTK